MENTISDFDHQISQNKPLPTALNVLTILTIIGCAFTLLSAFMIPLSCKMIDKMENAPGVTEKQIEAIEKTCENIGLNIGIIILGAILCFVGALLMRKLKSSGLIIYLAGTFVPLVISIILNGTSAYQDPKTIAMLSLSIIFPILYIANKKHLVN